MTNFEIIEKITKEINVLRYKQADSDTKQEWDVLEGKILGLSRAIDILLEEGK